MPDRVCKPDLPRCAPTGSTSRPVPRRTMPCSRAAARGGGAAARPEAGDRGDYRAGAPAQADPEDRRRGQHDRPRGGAGARHRGRQHAGHQHAGRRRGGAAADAGRAAQSGRARPGLPRGTGWAAGPALQERAGELRGRIVGLVGAGMVPRALVPILHGFGARPVYWSRAEHPELGIPRVRAR